MNSGRAQSELFEPAASVLPEGMRYTPEFLTPAEEETLVALAITFRTARRR